MWTEHKGRWLHLEAHAIWQSPSGEYIDVNPKADGEKSIVFVHEELSFHGHSIPSKYIDVSENEDVRRYLELHLAIRKIEESVPAGQTVVAPPEYDHLQEAIARVAARLFRDEIKGKR